MTSLNSNMSESFQTRESGDKLNIPIFNQEKDKTWLDKLFSRSFYKKRTAIYMDGKINYSTKKASFGSFVIIIGIPLLIIF